MSKIGIIVLSGKSGKRGSTNLLIEKRNLTGLPFKSVDKVKVASTRRNQHHGKDGTITSYSPKHRDAGVDFDDGSHGQIIISSLERIKP